MKKAWILAIPAVIVCAAIIVSVLLLKSGMQRAPVPFGTSLPA